MLASPLLPLPCLPGRAFARTPASGYISSYAQRLQLLSSLQAALPAHLLAQGIAWQLPPAPLRTSTHPASRFVSCCQPLPS